MEIYLVRHGQTDGNVARRHQHPEILLNEKGRLQAMSVAKLLRKVRPTHLISSTAPRALETAKFIGLDIDVIPETYPCFEELKRPDYLLGERMLAGESLKYVAGWFFGLQSASMHDGESLKSFQDRIHLALEHLLSLPPKSRVVIVSHSVFINFLLEEITNGGRFGLRRAIIRFWHILKTPNTAVTHLRYKNERWQIVEKF